MSAKRGPLIASVKAAPGTELLVSLTTRDAVGDSVTASPFPCEKLKFLLLTEDGVRAVKCEVTDKKGDQPRQRMRRPETGGPVDISVGVSGDGIIKVGKEFAGKNQANRDTLPGIDVAVGVTFDDMGYLALNLAGGFEVRPSSIES